MKFTKEQEKVFNYVYNNDEIGVTQTVLRGYAGTGKTSVASRLIKELSERDCYTEYNPMRCLVIAPSATAVSNLKDKVDCISDLKANVRYKTFAQTCQLPVQKVNFLHEEFIIDSDSVSIFIDHLLNFGISRDDIDLFLREIEQTTIVDGELKVKRTDYIIDEKKAKEVIENALGGKLKKDDFKVEIEFEYLSIDEIAANLENMDLIILDEISMLSLKDITVFQSALDIVEEQLIATYESNETYNSRQPFKFIKNVVYCGDGGQLPAVKGQVNQLIKCDVDNSQGIFELDEILRNSGGIVEIAHSIRKGANVQNISTKGYDNVVMYKLLGMNLEECLPMIEDMITDTDVIITYTNKNVKKLNETLRYSKRKLTKDDELREGEPILVTKNKGYSDNGVMFSNGEHLIVNTLYTKEQTLTILNQLFEKVPSDYKEIAKATLYYVTKHLKHTDIVLGKFVNKMGVTKRAWIDLKLKKHIKADLDTKELINKLDNLCDFLGLENLIVPFIECDFGYAMTIHKAQGSEWKDTTILLSSQDLAITRKNKNYEKLVYTAITRAKEKLNIILTG